MIRSRFFERPLRRSPAWLLGALLCLPACGGEGGDPQDTEEMNKDPDTGKDKPKEGSSDKNKGDKEDSSGEKDSSGPDSNKGSTGDDSSSDKSGDESTGDDKKINCDKLKVSGTKVGEVPEDMMFLAGNGKKLSLHEHCNSVILLMTGTAQ